MAHTCPECGSICHCHGDIDDIDFGEDYGCDCCLDEDHPGDSDYEEEV